MSESGSSGDNPFEGFGFFGDLARLLRSQGPVSWDAARQLARHVATGGQSEPNPDPTERLRLEELARVADLRVVDATGLPTSTTGAVVRVVPVTREEWSRRTLDAYRPLLERLSSSMSAAGGDQVTDDEVGDPTAQLIGNLFSMIGPMMLGMQAGAMVGHLASRALGQYDLPIPRAPSDELMLVGANLEAFGRGWGVPADDLRLWVCLSELTTHAVLGLPHVRAELEGLVMAYVSTFRFDPGALESRLADIDPTDPAALQRVMGDPGMLLGAVQTPEQRGLLPRVEALTAVVVGYVDHVMAEIGAGLVPSHAMLTEALHRRRVETSTGERSVQHLLGLQLGTDHYERGGAFVSGVVERSGPEGLARLWRSTRELPTPAEVDAPGLWLARIDLPDAG